MVGWRNGARPNVEFTEYLCQCPRRFQAIVMALALPSSGARGWDGGGEGTQGVTGGVSGIRKPLCSVAAMPH
jgi:hypothetical protein